MVSDKVFVTIFSVGWGKKKVYIQGTFSFKLSKFLFKGSHYDTVFAHLPSPRKK